MPGDQVLVSGSLCDQSIAVMLAREEFGLRGDVESDCVDVLPFTKPLLDIDGFRFMRDHTCGGFATACHEFKQASGFGVRVQQTAIPLKGASQFVCAILGYDPIPLTSPAKGRVIAVVAPKKADEALQRWQAIVGEITSW